MDLRRGDKRVTLSDLSIYYKWKNITNLQKNNKLIDDNIVVSASKLNSDLLHMDEYKKFAQKY